MRPLLKVAPILVFLPLLVGVSTCTPTDSRKNYSILKFTKSPTAELARDKKQVSVHTDPGGTMWQPFWNFTRTHDRLTDVCTDENKVVCEWDADPNNPRVFESTNGVNGHAWNGSPTDVENRARCVQPRTAAGICEDHLALVGGQSWNVSAVSVFDIGECSSSMPTEEFAALIAEEWRKGNEDRLGTGDPPNSDDITLWSDLTVGLKNGDFPPEVFFDWTIGPTMLLPRGATSSELVARVAYRVDGNMDWSFQRSWLNEDDYFGNPLDSRFWEGFSLAVQGLIRFNPVTFWLPIVLGNCEKDRPAVVQIRGAFEATTEGVGGVGVDVNSNNNCGPFWNWPCSWSSVLDWPARPYCNNHIKGRIENWLLSGAYVQFGEQPADVRDDDGYLLEVEECFTCTPEGSILPFRYSRGYLPILEVVQTPTRVHFVHFKEAPPHPDDLEYSDGLAGSFERLAAQLVWEQYVELKFGGHCGRDRAIPAETVYLRKQGEHL